LILKNQFFFVKGGKQNTILKASECKALHSLFD